MNVLASALAALAISGIPAPPAMPEVRQEACPAFPTRSCTSPGGPIYLNPDDGGDPAYHQYALLHEMGHQYDYQKFGGQFDGYTLNQAARDKFRALIDDPRPWRADGGNSPHEQFAEAYALCALRARGAHAAGRVWGAYNYHPTLRRHKRICLLIRRTGAAP